MPRYYIMDLGLTMRQCVAADMAAEDPAAVSALSSRWLDDTALAVYVSEYSRNSFQGGLNWYRIQTQRELASDVEFLSGMKISIPCMFVAGDRDWGTWQEPGAVEAMESGKSVRSDCWRG